MTFLDDELSIITGPMKTRSRLTTSSTRPDPLRQPEREQEHRARPGPGQDAAAKPPARRGQEYERTRLPMRWRQASLGEAPDLQRHPRRVRSLRLSELRSHLEHRARHEHRLPLLDASIPQLLRWARFKEDVTSAPTYHCLQDQMKRRRTTSFRLALRRYPAKRDAGGLEDVWYEKYQPTGGVETEQLETRRRTSHQESSQGQIELLMTDETRGRYIPCCTSAPCRCEHPGWKPELYPGCAVSLESVGANCGSRITNSQAVTADVHRRRA